MGHKLIVLPPTERFIIIGAILLIALIIRGSQFLLMRGKPASSIPLGEPRDYGLMGGAVCPKCHRPFRLGMVAFKLGIGTKFARCEFCGKWSLVQRLGIDELRAAEKAELAEAQPQEPVREKSETEKLAEMVDESRYTDRR